MTRIRRRPPAEQSVTHDQLGALQMRTSWMNSKRPMHCTGRLAYLPLLNIGAALYRQLAETHQRWSQSHVPRHHCGAARRKVWSRQPLLIDMFRTGRGRCPLPIRRALPVRSGRSCPACVPENRRSARNSRDDRGRNPPPPEDSPASSRNHSADPSA